MSLDETFDVGNREKCIVIEYLLCHTPTSCSNFYYILEVIYEQSCWHC